MTAILVPAGLLLSAAAIYHGYLGQTRLIGPATFTNRQAKALVGLIWQFSTVTWAICGFIIALSPWLFDDEARLLAVLCACLPVVYGIAGNCWITRGRHFGWKVFAAVVGLAVVGALLG